MEQAKNENLALQLERRELIAANFEPGYVDDSPICDRCGGTGYVGSTMCECLAELCRQEQKRELTFLNVGKESFEQFRLDYYPDRIDPRQGVNIRAVMEKTFQICRRYAMEFTERSENLLFSGGTGLGKTFLSACIARTVADRGYSVCYETASHLFSKLERAKFSGDEDARRETEKYTACDLLIVDDLGTEMGGQFTTSALYSLVNDRILDGKATIISTNLNSEDLEKRYSAAIASRLRGNYRRIAFMGEDIRLKKNR
jgi:DNA replication protein DnaC